MNVWAIVLTAIALQAAGQVVQKYRVSVRTPDATLGDVLRRPHRFFGALLRDPAWLLSHVLNFGGAILGLQAVSMLDLSVFKSLWQLQSLLVVLAGALLLREHLMRVEALGIAVMLAGALVLAASGVEESGTPASTQANLTFVSGAAAALALLAAGSRWWPARVTPEIALALSVGVLFGLGDVMTKGATALVESDGSAFRLTDPQSLLVLVTRIEFLLAVASVGTGLLLLQTAFAVGRVSVVGPLTGIGGLLLPIVVGLAFLGERMDPGRLIAVGLMTGGTLLLGARELERAPQEVL